MVNRRPTIVIGVGGVGGRIVSEATKHMTPEDKKYIATICLDTNINDLKKLSDKGIDYVVQTSTDQTVLRYVQELEENGVPTRDWIHNIPLMNERTMLKGAGQIRQLSRIAMLSAVESGKFKAIDEAIVNINSSGSTFEQDVSVFIVGSVAGGTCAGTMVQLPLYVRKLLIQRSAATDPNIRGLFIGASVTEGYQEGNTTKIRDTYANDYACIKEVNGFYHFASSPKDDIPVSLEFYEPTKVIGGDGVNPIPYKYIFLLERFNHLGKSIPGGAKPKDYEAMAANILLAQLSQIGDEAEGSEDNLIRKLIQENGMSRYCGAGAINIEYPYEDIREYCALRCSEDSVKNQWRRIDEEYLIEKKQQAQRAKVDSTYEEESFEDFYIRKFEEYTEKGSADSFFRSLSGDLKEFGKKSKDEAANQNEDDIFFVPQGDTEAPTDRITMAKSAIEDLIKKDSQENYQVSSARYACNISESDITAPEAGSEDVVVLRTLRAIGDYTAEVKNNLSYGYDTANKIVSVMHYEAGTGMSAPWIMDKSDYNIAHVIRSTHPIVSRYILMKLRNYAKVELEKAIEAEQNLRGRLDYINTMDFDGDESNGIQNANTVYSNIIYGKNKRGFKLFGKKNASTPLDDFAGLFTAAVRGQVVTINSYHAAAYRHRVFDDVLKRINVLLQAYTIMFDSLPDVTKSLSEQVMDLETRHEEINEDIARYVFARKTHKLVAYNMISSSLSTEDLPAETKDKFAQEIYNLFTDYYQKTLTADEDERDFYRDELNRYSRNLFNSTIFPSIKHAVSDSVDQLLDKGVIKAIEFEVLCDDELKKHDGDIKGASSTLGRMIKTGNYDLTDEQKDKMRDVIREVLSRAEPFIGVDGKPAGRAVYWGTNPAVMSQGVNEAVLMDLVNVRTELPRIVNDEAFTTNELRCYSIFYAISPEDLKSYKDGSPAQKYYAQAISDVISKNVRGKNVDEAASPHIDKRWHMEAYLPELDPRKELRNRANDLIATIELLAYGGVKTDTYDDKMRWVYTIPIYPVEIFIEGKLAEVERKGNRSYTGLYRSMAFNPVIKENTIARIREARAEDISGETDIEANILQHYGISMLLSIPDILGIYNDVPFTALDLMAELSNSMSRTRYVRMVEAFKAYVFDYCRESCRAREGQNVKVYKDIMKALVDRSRSTTLEKQELKRIGEIG